MSANGWKHYGCPGLTTREATMTNEQTIKCALEIRKMLKNSNLVGNLRGHVESLCAAVLRNAEKHYVNVYLVNRHYGGPEEGGWWFEAGEVIESFCCNSEEECLKMKQELLTGEYSNKGRAPLSSTQCAGVYWIKVEADWGKDFPTKNPCYE